MRSQMLTRVAAGACFLFIASFAHAQPPSGSEIAQKAGSARLVSANAVTAQKNGQRFQVTPINTDGIRSADQLDRKVLGVLKIDGSGTDEGFKPGTYHVFVAKIGGKWHAYLESAGRVVVEASRVDVVPNSSRPEITLARADAVDSPVSRRGAISDAVPAMFSKCTKVSIIICGWSLRFEYGC